MPSDTDRSERLAAALRANLARRKAQARARRAPSDAPGHAGSGGNPASDGSTPLPAGKPEIVPDDEAG